MRKLVSILCVSMLPMLAQAQGEVWSVKKKIDEMTGEAKIWICGAKPTEANEDLFEMRSVFCAVCETKGRRGYAFFSDKFKDGAYLAGKPDYRLIPDFASDKVKVYPARIRSTESVENIEVFMRSSGERPVHFVDWPTVERHALLADSAGEKLLLQLEHYQKGFQIWRYEMTGLGEHLVRECGL